MSRWDGPVGRTAGYGLDDQGSIRGRARICSVLHSFQTCSGGQPSLLSSGYRELFPWGYNSCPPSNAKIKNGGAIPPLPTRLHGVMHK
jgi:hypothetical protein